MSDRCDHDWHRPDGHSWWECSHCIKQMHPSWTPESREQFEAGIDFLQLELTKPEDVVSRIFRKGRDE